MATHPLVAKLKTAPTADPEARNAALVAVDAMMMGASRSAQLLAQAQAATMDGSVASTVQLQRAAMLANQAYRERTNAEVAKYRAMYAIAAEEAGNKAVSWSNVAQQARDDRAKAVAFEKSKYHTVQRDLMVQAANATANALKAVPPLPLVGPQQATQDDMYRPVEAHGRPSFGWRPTLYRELAGSFYPADVRRAAGGLSGMGDGTSDQQPPVGTTSPWDALLHAFGAGVQATGAAAAQEGQKVATSNPSGGAVIGTAGNILAALTSAMGFGAKAGGAGPNAAPATSTFPWVPLVGGIALAGAGLILFKHFHKRG